MRILILNHNDRDKGTFFRCFALGKNLAKLGHDIVLSCLNTVRNTLKISEIQEDGVLLYLVPGQHGDSSITELPAHLYRAIINTKVALSRGFDVVYAFNVASPTTGLPIVILSLLKKLGIFKGQIVVDCDDFWGEGGLTTIDGKGLIMEKMAGFMERKIPTLADRITAVSHNLVQMMKDSGADPSNVFLILNGSDPFAPHFMDTSVPRAGLNLPSDQPILCFVGRALWVFDYLMDSLVEVVKKRQDTLVLLIAPLTNKHHQEIKRLGLSDNINTLGVQPHEKINAYLGAADVLLLPRVNNGSEKYNFPGRLGDYLAAGRPIVATAIGDETERVMREYNCGLLAQTDNPSDFAQKIIQLLDNPSLCLEKGKNNHKTATNKLNWTIVAQDLEDSVLKN